MRIGKRIFDLVCAGVGLIPLLPVFALVAIMIKLDDRGPVFFRQRRIGLHGREFLMWKFRTMVVDAEKRGKQLTVGRDPRVTRAGHWLRKSKLDELPQLFNVILGDMSLVGPRPEVARYVDIYTDDQRAVLELMPGITDPASIKYRSESETLEQSPDPEATYINEVMPEKIRLNLEYGCRANTWTDFLVILQTLKRIAC